MRNKKAFTLAETLTTLTIIGVIAAITIPIFRAETSSKILTQQKKTFESKFKDSLHVMQLKGALADGYDTTADFLKSFEKYANVAKICPNNNLDGCFASKVLANKSVVKFETSDLNGQSATAMGAVFDSDIGTFILGNGASVIIAYKPNCPITNRYDVTYDVTECMSLIYDVNGKEGPNMLGEDMETINMDYKIADMEMIFTDGHCNQAANCWAYANEECNRRGKHLPDLSEMQEIAARLYGVDKNNINMSANVETTGLTISDRDIWNKLGSPAGGYNYWTANQANENQAHTSFINTDKIILNYVPHNKTQKYRALCVQ